jgi:hypothetical protein
MERVWTTLAGKRLVLLVLSILILIRIAALLLPQIPVSTAEAAAFNRWLAELRPRLGQATRPLASLGLLTIRSSLIIRIALSALALVAAANLDRLRQLWQARDEGQVSDEAQAPNEGQARERGARTLIAIGALLLIGGWVGQMLWGWQDPEVVAWPDQMIMLPQRNLTIAQPSGPIGMVREKFGLYVLSRGERVGLEVQVTDADGATTHLLLPSVQEDPQPSLRLAFTTRDPEAFFAVPDADIIMRLNQIMQTIQIQAYRSASGDLLAETTLAWTDTGAQLEVDDIRATFSLTRLPRYELIYNPGAIADILGFLLIATGGLLLPTIPRADRDEGGEAAPEDEDPGQETER